MLRRAVRHRERRGVTLLEAIVAMTILAGVGVATLQLRAATLAGAHEAERAAIADRGVQDLLDLAVAGLLAGGAEQEGGALVWKGTHLGEAYVVRREVVVLPNPLYSKEQAEEDDLAPAETMPCHEYVAEWGGAVAKMLRPIQRRR